MTDIVSKEKRSQMMAGIKSTNTKLEVLIRRALFARGFRFRIHSKTIPGKPDIALPKYRAVIFVHGCFWHGHACSLFKTPSTRIDFWLAKFESNQHRDRVVASLLFETGWRSLIIWECALRGANAETLLKIFDKVENWIKSEKPSEELCKYSLAENDRVKD
jgi:DNA mismatch endonuclease (patch repair protein)